jgi:hypothetical protein
MKRGIDEEVQKLKSNVDAADTHWTSTASDKVIMRGPLCEEP